MRCGCPQCGTYMIQSEGTNFGCVCPECLYRCRACMGTNTVVSRENLHNLVFVDHTAEHEAQEETGDGPKPAFQESGNASLPDSHFFSLRGGLKQEFNFERV